MGIVLNSGLVLKAMSIYGRISRNDYYRKSKKLSENAEGLLMRILRRNRNTEIGKKLGFGSVHSVRDYQDKIPFSDYGDYAGYIDRMAKNGEQKLLTADKVSFLATTSGTTGVMKRIPVVSRSFRPLFRSSCIIYDIIYTEMKKRGIKSGKGLNSLESGFYRTESGIRQGYISSFVMSSADLVVPSISCIPAELSGYGEGVDMKYIKSRCALADRDLVYPMSPFMSTLTDLMKYISDNREMLIRDIELGVIDTSVKLPPELRARLEAKLKPDRERAEELKKSVDFSDINGLIKRIWPKMCVVVAIGSGELEPFSRKMRVYCGESVAFCHEFYASSEALFGTVTEADDENYLLIPDSGFFEFIPDDGSFDETRDRPLLPHELEVGKRYEVVVTNLAGLYRYRIKDVVLVTGFTNDLPRLRFAYRRSQVINITGLKLTSEHLVSTMREISEKTGVNIIDYSVSADTVKEPWRLVVFIEFDGKAPEGVDLSELFDEELSKVNEEHGHMLEIGESSPSMVCVMKSGFYKALREENASKKSSATQVKPVRHFDSEEMLRYFMERADIVQERNA